MNNTKTSFPILNLDDIRILKGEPMGKRFEITRNLPQEEIEEWIYYNTATNTKESYTFKNQELVSYEAQQVYLKRNSSEAPDSIARLLQKTGNHPSSRKHSGLRNGSHRLNLYNKTGVYSAKENKKI
jgi:hypothetical protein